MEKSSLFPITTTTNVTSTLTTFPTTTSIISTEHKLPGYAPIKKEYIDNKHDSPAISCGWFFYLFFFNLHDLWGEGRGVVSAYPFVDFFILLIFLKHIELSYIFY